MSTEAEGEDRAVQRRKFLKGVAALGLVTAGGSLAAACQSASTGGASSGAGSQSAPAAQATAPEAKPAEFTIRQLNTTPVIDAQSAFTTVGNHKRLNFYAQEGIGQTFTGVQGAESVLQALAAAKAEIGTYNPLNVLPAVVAGNDLGLKVLYIQHNRAYWGVRVKEDSPIKEYKDLAGKKIGIIREGDTGPNAAKFHLRQVGIDPEKDVTWPVVGQGASAGQALMNGAVDALAIWDAEFARMELLGFKMRELTNPGNADKLFGFGNSTRGNLDWKQYIPKFMRAYFKGSIFTITNPEAAIKLHWELYPDSKPTGMPEEEALRQQLYILNVRAPWYGPRTADGKSPDMLGTWGYNDPAKWEAWVDFLGLREKIKDPTVFYTNEFIEEANKFDKQAIVQMAKEFKV